MNAYKRPAMIIIMALRYIMFMALMQAVMVMSLADMHAYWVPVEYLMMVNVLGKLHS